MKYYGYYVRKLTKADFFETKGITLVQSAWTDSPAQAHKVVLTRIPAQTYEPISEDLCNRKIFGLTVSLQGFLHFVDVDWVLGPSANRFSKCITMTPITTYLKE